MRFRSARNSILCAAALAVLAGACSQPPLLTEQEVSADILETHVWNNFMPGSTPRCHAVMSVTFSNLTDDPFLLRPGTAVITNAYNRTPMRSFTPVMLVDDMRADTLRIPPGEKRTVMLRSPDTGLDTIDFSLFGEIRIRLLLPVSEDRSIELESRPTVGFTTE
jgi:hypothetical protein